MLRAPKKVKPFVFVYDEDIIYRFSIDKIKGLGSIVFQILCNRPNATVWNSRELATEIVKHPEFNSIQDPASIANYWICKFKMIGLIQ